MTNNEKTTSKIISIGKNKILISTWPTLPYSLLKNNSKLISLWKKILVILIDTVILIIKIDEF